MLLHLGIGSHGDCSTKLFGSHKYYCDGQWPLTSYYFKHSIKYMPILLSKALIMNKTGTFALFSLPHDTLSNEKQYLSHMVAILTRPVCFQSHVMDYALILFSTCYKIILYFRIFFSVFVNVTSSYYHIRKFVWPIPLIISCFSCIVLFKMS